MGLEIAAGASPQVVSLRNVTVIDWQEPRRYWTHSAFCRMEAITEFRFPQRTRFHFNLIGVTMAVASPSKTTRMVKSQYESFPYPMRNPADESKRLNITSLDELGILNQYCYRGKQSFRNGFRVLVAGGGTGDSTVYLGHQLKDFDATIVHLDLSDASIDIARGRARCRGFEDKITWIKGSLLDLPEMGLESFDYINCSGVLHHLADPSAGLAALNSVLKDEGAIGLMVYGQYGRTGIYQIQEMMRQMIGDETDSRTKTEMARAMVGALPRTNWFERGRDLFRHDETNDSDINDMFLHSQDRAYTVLQLYEFLDQQELHVAEFSSKIRVFLDPGYLFRDPVLQNQIAALPKRRQQAIAEIFYGTIKNHVCWVSRNFDTKIDVSDPENVPFFGCLATIGKIRDTILAGDKDECKIAVTVESNVSFNVSFKRVPPALRFVELIDGQRTMGELVETIQAEFAADSSTEDVWKFARHLVDLLMKYDLLLLRHKSVPAYSTD